MLGEMNRGVDKEESRIRKLTTDQQITPCLSSTKKNCWRKINRVSRIIDKSKEVNRSLTRVPERYEK